jgi:hypothetical protein
VKPMAVVVATMTLARDEVEERLLLRSLARLSEREWPIVVTDGGSSSAFTERLLDIGGIELHRANGLVPQIARSISGALAHDAPLILYTEPDKLEFFDAHVEALIARAGEHGPCLATRSSSSFRTYPAHQRATETTINRRCGEAFGIAGDFSYGPFVLPRSLAIDLRTMPTHLGWGWRHFAFAVAHRLGYRITMFEGNFSCPPHGHRDEDEDDRVHRDRQLRENLEGLALGLAIPLPR